MNLHEYDIVIPISYDLTLCGLYIASYEMHNNYVVNFTEFLMVYIIVYDQKVILLVIHFSL